MNKNSIILILSVLLISCSKDDSEPVVIENPSSDIFYYGADLSYVNEMKTVVLSTKILMKILKIHIKFLQKLVQT